MRKFIVLWSALLFAAAIPAYAQTPVKATAAKVEALKKERRDVTQKLVTILLSQYRVGTVDFNRLADGLIKAADAELDLAKTKDQRIAVWKKQVEVRRDVEKVCQGRFNAGTVTEADLLEAQAERMKAEIRLLSEE